MRFGSVSMDLKGFSRASAKSTSGGESAYAGRASNAAETSTGTHPVQEDHEPVLLQPPSGTSVENVERFLDQAALSAIEFQTPDFNRYNKIDKAAEAVEDFTRSLYRHSPTFRRAIDKATGTGTAQPSRIAVRQGKTLRGYEGEYIPEERNFGEGAPTHITVRTDPHHPSFRNNRDQILGTATFELINAASREHLRITSRYGERGAYEQVANDSNLTPAEVYARDLEYEEWSNAKQHHQAMVEARADGMHVPPSADTYRYDFGTAERPGRWSNFENYYSDQVKNGHAQIYIDDYERHFGRLHRPQEISRPSSAAKLKLGGANSSGEATKSGSS